MEVLKKNLKEDILVLALLSKEYEGESFRIIFTSGKNVYKKYICSYNRETGEYVNCEMVDDTHVLCKLDNHGLPCGLVSIEITIYLPDESMQDGNYKFNDKKLLEFEHEGKMKHLEIVDGNSDVIFMPEVTFNILAPIRKGDPFRFEDFTEEQINELKRPATEAAERFEEEKEKRKQTFTENETNRQKTFETNEQERQKAFDEHLTKMNGIFADVNNVNEYDDYSI